MSKAWFGAAASANRLAPTAAAAISPSGTRTSVPMSAITQASSTRPAYVSDRHRVSPGATLHAADAMAVSV